MSKRIVRRKGHVSEIHRFRDYVAQVNAASQDWSGQPAAPATLPEGLLRREYAWRKGDFMSEVIIPLCHALGYGVIGAGAGWFLAHLGALPRLESMLGGGGITFTCAYIITTRNMLRSMWTIEEFGSEEIEEIATRPPTPHVPIRVDVVEGPKMHRVHLPPQITEAQMHALATHCLLNQQPFSRRALKDILTQTEYEELFSMMVNAGLLRTNGNGNELTGAGRAILGKWR